MRAARAADDDDDDDDGDRFKRPGEERARLRAGARAERADCEPSNSRRFKPDWTWTTGRTALAGDGVLGAPGGERAAAASSGGGGDADAPAAAPARRDGATMSSALRDDGPKKDGC